MTLLDELLGQRDYWLVPVEPDYEIIGVARGENPPEIERRMSVTEHEMAAVLGYKGTLPSDEWLTTNLTERATDSVPLLKGWQKWDTSAKQKQ